MTWYHFFIIIEMYILLNCFAFYMDMVVSEIQFYYYYFFVLLLFFLIL